MKHSKKLIIVSAIIALSGFILAILSDDDLFGIVVFFVGFFLACGATVVTILSSPSNTFGGNMGIGVKIMAAGFGVIVFGQLLLITLKLQAIGEVFFSIGMLVMLSGIILAVIKKFK